MSASVCWGSDGLEPVLTMSHLENTRTARDYRGEPPGPMTSVIAGMPGGGDTGDLDNCPAPITNGHMNRVSPRWEALRTVAGFVSSPPNAELIAFARLRLTAGGGRDCLD